MDFIIFSLLVIYCSVPLINIVTSVNHFIFVYLLRNGLNPEVKKKIYTNEYCIEFVVIQLINISILDNQKTSKTNDSWRIFNVGYMYDTYNLVNIHKYCIRRSRRWH